MSRKMPQRIVFSQIRSKKRIQLVRTVRLVPDRPTIHSVSKIVVGIANTVTRAVLTLGMTLAMEYDQIDRGVGLIRVLGQNSTDFSQLA